ncbi:MAG: hypothetical protein HY606_09615 [Planctomycetes bacterium]|nr:hypothetical protein [Planctomycetota bacterium]
MQSRNELKSLTAPQTGSSSGGSCCGSDTNVKKEIKELKVLLPQDLRSGDTVVITVSSSLNPEKVPANSLEDIIESMKHYYKSTDLVVRISSPKKVYYYKGAKLTELPTSQLAKMVSNVNIWESSKFIDKVEETQYLLRHTKSIQLKVK